VYGRHCLEDSVVHARKLVARKGAAANFAKPPKFARPTVGVGLFADGNRQTSGPCPRPDADPKQIDSIAKLTGLTFENMPGSAPGHGTCPPNSVIGFRRTLGTIAANRWHRMSTNNRRTVRQSVNSPAWMETGRSTRLDKCRLVDISANGARLFVENIDETPDHFNLLLSRFGHPSYRCNVVWRLGNEVGVEFLVSPTSGARKAGEVE
jgi:PilZ domain